MCWWITDWGHRFHLGGTEEVGRGVQLAAGEEEPPCGGVCSESGRRRHHGLPDRVLLLSQTRGTEQFTNKHRYKIVLILSQTWGTEQFTNKHRYKIVLLLSQTWGTKQFTNEHRYRYMYEIVLLLSQTWGDEQRFFLKYCRAHCWLNENPFID